ncbi:MAG: glycoside hydrolase family 88 protein [Rikenellaceae bacterium]|jgi:unsaturated rhamnogalacturonyl hydrolase|nr:glycoside hydrolase family 88 protein [Rikenellaceae bacterium]
MKKLTLALVLVASAALALTSCKQKLLVDDKLPWSERIARSEMIRNPDPSRLDFVDSKKWNYTNGLVCEAFMGLYDRTGNDTYFNYAKSYADTLIDANGQVYGYRLSNYNLDHVKPGKFLFALYDKTQDPRYKTVLDTLRSQLRSQPRTTQGGFWHKQIYPMQMWLDGVYMGDPLYAEYIRRWGDPSEFDDVFTQFFVIAERTYDPKNGLYRHAFDDSPAGRKMDWADPVTGQSEHVWGRGLGWYYMAVVDVLDYIPEDQPKRDSLIRLFNKITDVLVREQDPETGGWWQVMDLPGEYGNYIETTGTSMFAYGMLKGVRKGYLAQSYLTPAMKAYNGLLEKFVTVDEQGLVSLTKCCAGAGLGGNPYRDGTFNYYINTTVRDNDAKGIGPLIMAALEVEALP